MIVFTSPKAHKKVCTKFTDLIVGSDDDGFNFIRPEIRAVCPIVNPNPGTITVPPTLCELLAKKAKGDFCREVAASFRMSGSYYFYYLHGILACYNLLYAAVQTVVPNFDFAGFL